MHLNSGVFFRCRRVQKFESSVSRGIPVVVGKQSAKPLVAVHLPYFRRSKIWHDERSAPEQDPQQTGNQRILL
jgi:hypothetical protein